MSRNRKTVLGYRGARPENKETTMQADKAALVMFRPGGHAVYCQPTGTASRITLSGYETPETWEPVEELVVPAGTPVLDLRPALEADPALAVRAPLLRVDLEPGEIDRWADGLPDDPVLRALALAPAAGFGSVGALAVVEAAKPPGAEPGPMDRIGVSDYVHWWTAHGARAGRWDGQRISWDD